MYKISKEQLHLRNMFHHESQFKPMPGLRLNYRYTIKVWFTSILLGTSFFFAYKLIRDLYNSGGADSVGISTLFYYIIALALAVILSVPCLLLFAASYNFIAGYIYSSFRIKVSLTVISQALCWLSFFIGFGASSEAISVNLDIILPYAIASFMSVLLYRLSSGN